MSACVRMPSLGGATEWLNSEPLGPAELRYPNLVYFNELAFSSLR